MSSPSASSSSWGPATTTDPSTAAAVAKVFSAICSRSLQEMAHGALQVPPAPPSYLAHALHPTPSRRGHRTAITLRLQEMADGALQVPPAPPSCLTQALENPTHPNAATVLLPSQCAGHCILCQIFHQGPPLQVLTVWSLRLQQGGATSI